LIDRVPRVEAVDDGLGWSEPEKAELARLAPGLLPGRIMTCDLVGALVLTELGSASATYGAALLLGAARARSAGRLWPKPGDRVALRRWPDGPVTVEGVVA
jgi:ribosome biogenesis GTPase